MIGLAYLDWSVVLQATKATAIASTIAVLVILFVVLVISCLQHYHFKNIISRHFIGVGVFVGI